MKLASLWAPASRGASVLYPEVGGARCGGVILGVHRPTPIWVPPRGALGPWTRRKNSQQGSWNRRGKEAGVF